MPSKPRPYDAAVAAANRVLAAANRGLPKDMRRAIAAQSVTAFLRQAASLADCVFDTYHLASRNMLQNLEYVLAVKRCTPSPKFLALGLYARCRPYLNGPYLNVEPLNSTGKQHEDWLVHTRRPVRYVAAVFRVTPLHGPWKRGDRSPKVALEPMRSATAVLGGKDIHHARHALYSMTRGLARTAITDTPFMPSLPRM